MNALIILTSFCIVEAKGHKLTLNWGCLRWGAIYFRLSPSTRFLYAFASLSFFLLNLIHRGNIKT